jgi:hypothetical protein
MDDEMDVISPPKIKTYSSVEDLLGKLESRAAMWERVARENKERAEEFEGAAQRVRGGASSVTVGRTTYVLVDETGDAGHTEG